MGEKIVFAAYKPKEHKSSELKNLVARHHKKLQELGLASARKPIIIEANDGTILEIFGWISEQASSKAHEHPEVAAFWEAMANVCDFVPLLSLPGLDKLFPHFDPIN